jgi:Beta-lactamase
MNETFLYLEDARKYVERPDSSAHIATPYRWIVDSRNQTTDANQTGHFSNEPFLNPRPIAAAGSTLSTVNDYALFLRAMLRESTPISPSGHLQLRNPRIALPPELVRGAIPSYMSGPALYSLGWMWRLYRGREVFSHPGGLGGFGADMAFVPGTSNNDTGFAVAVMGNTAGTSNIVAMILSAYLMDEYLGIPEEERYDLETAIRQLVALMKESTKLENLKKAAYPEVFATPGGEDSVLPLPLSLDAYTGTYHNPGYGAFTVSTRNSTSSTTTTTHTPATNSAARTQYLHITPSPRTLSFSLPLTQISGNYFLAEIINPFPQSEIERHPERYPYGDEGEVSGGGRVLFDASPSGAVERMGIEISEEMVQVAVENAVKAGKRGRGREAMIWFEKL